MLLNVFDHKIIIKLGVLLPQSLFSSASTKKALWVKQGIRIVLFSRTGIIKYDMNRNYK